jgi:regulator of replication initiation timing
VSDKAFCSCFINRGLKRVAKDGVDKKTEQLAQAIHHIVCENELLKHENEGLQQALKIRGMRQK